MKKLFVLFLTVLVLATGVIASLAAFWLLRGIVPQGSTPPARDQTSLSTGSNLELVVPPGSSARAIGALLAQSGVNISPAGFAWTVRLLGVHHQLQAGVYALSPGSSLYKLIDQLSRGDALQEPITFIEGWTFAQVLNALHSHPHVRVTLPTEVSTASARLAAVLGFPGANLEGWIYPDTYLFHRGQTDVSILERAFRLQQRLLHEAWSNRAPDVRLKTPQEALILASIIERETQHPPDRAHVSAVFHNRLALGMRLQSDPTTIYGLGHRFDGNLRRSDLQDTSPYNTYRWPGLPPSPIANPGRAAIKAALNPEPSPALYFVARGDGQSYFSESLGQHNWAVNYYQRQIGPPPPDSRP